MGKQYQQLDGTERAMIQLSLEQGCKLRSIARSLQRDPGTISRELKRNGWQSPQQRLGCLGRPLIAGGYRACQAQQQAEWLTHQPRRERRLRPGTWLWTQMVSLLRRRHSPEQITGILKRMDAYNPASQISHETIYTALYALPRGALRTELITCLRQARKQRRPRARGTGHSGSLGGGPHQG